jgi:2',3'-cyclic-nucleotide 2'-phosphodiesterase (5'-nucleotidase family)
MKFKYLVYGIFVVSLLFAGTILYLRFWGEGVDESSSSAPIRTLVKDLAKTSSGKAGKLGVAYAGDLMGSLIPCKCTEPPSGGVARRAQAISDFKKQHQNIPILVVDTGNAMKQTDNAEDPANRWVVQALEALGNNVINTNLSDFLRLENLAQAGKIGKDLKNSFISTILETEASSTFPTKPFVVKTLRSEAGDVEVKVGVLAIASIPPGVASTEKTLTVGEALKRYLPEVDAQSDIVILLTRMKQDELKGIAQAYPAVDVIINGNSTGDGREYPRTGNTVMVESARQGIGLGTLDLEWDSKGHVTKYKNQTIPLLPVLPDSPELAQIVDKAHQDAAAYAEQEAKKAPVTKVKSIFAGPKSCKPCHENEYKIWAKSKHARAIETLKAKSSEYDDACLICHATGATPMAKKQGGFVNIIQTPELAAVTCESCHGTSLKHVASPKTVKTGLGIGIMPSEKTCRRCHTQEYSPNFVYKDYWGKIAHK